MASKTYKIPYDRQTKSWEAVTITAQVRNQGDKKLQKLTPEVLVEDAPNSAYYAMNNNVLLLEDTEIEARIEAGDVAKIKMRLNDGGPRLLQILQQNSRFKLKVTLRPELSKGGADPSKPGPPVEAVTEVYAELPQIWDLTFRKTLWHDAGVVDLSTIDGVPKDQLQALGDWGGTLILQPKGRLVDSQTQEPIASTATIEHAREIVLDRGDGKKLTGEWDPTRAGYVFKIEASQKGDGGGPAGQELTLAPPIEPHQGWGKQLCELLASARKIGRGLAPDVPQLAKTYVQGCLDHLAVKTEEELADRRRDLVIWILNTSNFIGFMDGATAMFNRGMKLFGLASDRFIGNLISFVIEIIFYMWNPLEAVAKSGAAQALKGSTREMIEEGAEATIRELAQSREPLEQGLRVAREGIESTNTRLARTTQQLQELGPKITDNPTPELMAQHSRVLAEHQQLLQQNTEFLSQRDLLKTQLDQVDANIALHRVIRDNAEHVTEKEFLEKIEQEALQHEALRNFNDNQYNDMLFKSPLAQQMKKANEEAQKAKQAAEGIRYQNMAWEHYQGFFSPLWWAMDWSLAQALWLYDLAREWIPGVALAEDLLAMACETIFGFVSNILNSVLDYANSVHWRRSAINSAVRGQGKATVLANGIHAGFFDFPQATADLPGVLEPRRVLMGDRVTSVSALKARFSGPAMGRSKQEITAQTNQARNAFSSLCRQALDAGRLEYPAPEQVSSGTIRNVWHALAGPMVKYENSFAAAGAQGTDYLWSIGTFAQNSTFQDWDGAIEWLGWSLAWGLRLGAVLAIFTGVGAAGSLVMFQAADWADRIGPFLRLMVGWLGTLPDVIAFQADVVVAAAVAYEAAIEGTASLDNLVVPSEYVSWSEL